MKVFVIGGTGFISSGVVDSLLTDGHSVTTFTRGVSMPTLNAPANLIRCFGDRRDADALRSAVDKKDYDVVYDFVAYDAVDSRLSIDVFADRTERFVHCSTVSVYMVSDEVACPITEDQNERPLMAYWPRNPFGMDYGLGKRDCEAVLWKAHEERRFAVTMLRPTYVSGPADPARRDWFWIQRILDGGPLVIPGCGDHPFQQVFVDDVVRAFVSVLNCRESVGKAYNVASEEIYSLNDYLSRLSRLLDRTPERVHIDQEVFDRLSFSSSAEGDVFPFNVRRTAVFSLSRSIDELGYRSTPFESWMSRTIDWYVGQGKPSVGYAFRDREIVAARLWRGGRAESVQNFLQRVEGA
ncbi:MAG: NAD-dependent epimerase/dehydratase family protein [Rhodothermales bacterium]|nr:NAD-dependent epimerase/dehydratase family protein [Rhodothermales bacterium]